MAKAIQRTVLAASLSTAKILGLAYPLVPNTTLNEKLSIQSGITSSDSTVTPTLKYWVIGDGGHNITSNGSSQPYVTPVQHRPSDFGLFNQVPFVLRLPADDLTAAQQANYGLRRLETHSGTQYVAYYAKRLDTSTTAVTLHKTVIVDGVSTTTTFVPDESNLNPTKPVVTSTTTTTANGTYLSASAPLTITFSEFDATEFLNVAKILYGDENTAAISEIALVTGIDLSVPLTNSSSTASTFNEIIMAQIYTHFSAYYAVAFAEQGFEFTVDVGHTEPLAAEGNVSA